MAHRISVMTQWSSVDTGYHGEGKMVQGDDTMEQSDGTVEQSESTMEQ